jgi:hypothetical protein
MSLRFEGDDEIYSWVFDLVKGCLINLMVRSSVNVDGHETISISAAGAHGRSGWVDRYCLYHHSIIASNPTCAGF